jgi:hypothetical protein
VTPLNITLQYNRMPSERALRAMDQVREVYGIRRVSFDEKARAVQVEYDASRLLPSDVAVLLTTAGIALQEWPPQSERRSPAS